MRLALALALLLALPAAAGAHSTVVGSRGEVTYTTEDVTSANCLRVELRAGNLYFRDFEDGPPKRYCVDAGLNASGDCLAGNETDSNAYYYDASCPRAGKTLIRIDVGSREDRVEARIDVPIQLLAGDGADTITLGDPNDVLLGGSGNDTLDSGGGDDLIKDEDGDDTVRAGAGNDQLQGGLGADTYDAGEGDDDVRARDGIKDTIVCGAGTDKVDADTLDSVAADCENVTRTAVAPPAGTGGDPNDRRAPVLEVGAYTLQRVLRTRRVRIFARSSERGTVAASGRLSVGGIFRPIKLKPRRILTAGSGVTLTVKLSKGMIRQLRRDLRKRRRPYLLMDVVATDLAGNSVSERAPKIRLAR